MLCFNEVVSNSVHYYIINYFRHAEYALVTHPGTDHVFADTLNLSLWIYNKNKTSLLCFLSSTQPHYLQQQGQENEAKG